MSTALVKMKIFADFAHRSAVLKLRSSETKLGQLQFLGGDHHTRLAGDDSTELNWRNISVYDSYFRIARYAFLDSARNVPNPYVPLRTLTTQSPSREHMMKQLILPLICSLAFFSATANGQKPKDEAERPQALRVVDAWLDSVQAYRHIPALSAGVVVGDDMVWSTGFGTIDASHTVAASPRTSGKVSGFLHHSNTTLMESPLPNTKISIKQ